MKKNTEVKVGDLYFYKGVRDEGDLLFLITKVNDDGAAGTGYWLLGKNTAFWGKLSMLNEGNFKLVKRNNHTICERCNHE